MCFVPQRRRIFRLPRNAAVIKLGLGRCCCRLVASSCRVSFVPLWMCLQHAFGRDFVCAIQFQEFTTCQQNLCCQFWSCIIEFTFTDTLRETKSWSCNAFCLFCFPSRMSGGLALLNVASDAFVAAPTPAAPSLRGHASMAQAKLQEYPLTLDNFLLWRSVVLWLNFSISGAICILYYVDQMDILKKDRQCREWLFAVRVDQVTIFPAFAGSELQFQRIACTGLRRSCGCRGRDCAESRPTCTRFISFWSC